MSFVNGPFALPHVVLATMVSLGVGCRSTPPAESEPSAKAGAATSFVCDSAHDYRAFARSQKLKSLNNYVPRKEQTERQRYDLTPGDPLWQFEERPEARCSADRNLELRYAATGSGGFASARNRLTVTIAPGGRLLDPMAHDRMAALANALDEALTLLRTKSCSTTSGESCDLTRNKDPLIFPDCRLQYTVGTEFYKVGQRAWYWYFCRGPHEVLRAVFTTTDGRFDVEIVVEETREGSQDDTGALHLLPELLSDEYDKAPRPDGGAFQGGHGG